MSAGNITIPSLVTQVVIANRERDYVGSRPCLNGFLCKLLYIPTQNYSVTKQTNTHDGQWGKDESAWVLSALDLTIVVLYLIMSLSLGLWYGYKRKGGTDEYFLAGRKSSWPVVGLSIFASNISSTTLVGLAGDAYAYGISVYNYEWTAAVVMILAACIFLPGLLRSNVFTIPELLHCMYK